MGTPPHHNPCRVLSRGDLDGNMQRGGPLTWNFLRREQPFRVAVNQLFGGGPLLRSCLFEGIPRHAGERWQRVCFNSHGACALFGKGKHVVRMTETYPERQQTTMVECSCPVLLRVLVRRESSNQPSRTV